MTINICRYDFEGPYNDSSLDEIREKLGVYVVLCLVDRKPHCVLDIGTSEGGIGRGHQRVPTKRGNLKQRLKTHKRRHCWGKNAHGDIGYAVHYIDDINERLDIEEELQWKLDYACGDNPWKDREVAWQEYQELERKFGPRGSAQL